MSGGRTEIRTHAEARLTPQLKMCDAERVFFCLFPQQDEDADDEMNQYT